MIEVESGMSATSLRSWDLVPYNGELSRLITAAVVNQKFCNLLLASPAIALAAGYNGESFRLTPGEQELVVSIRASSLTDFAIQVTGNGRNYDSRRLHSL